MGGEVERLIISLAGGEDVEAASKWLFDRKRCQQFKAGELHMSHPASLEGIECYPHRALCEASAQVRPLNVHGRDARQAARGPRRQQESPWDGHPAGGRWQTLHGTRGASAGLQAVRASW